MRGCKKIAEVTAEDGIRMTRARTALAATTTVSKRRKDDGGELELSTTFVQLETRTLSIMTPENSDSGNSTCESFSSDHVLASCFSSNEINEVVKENSKFSDLQEENEIVVEVQTSTYDLVDCRESGVTTPSSEVEAELESTSRPREANSRSRSTMQKMPSETELQEFFAAAEKDLQKQFTDKYNFDILEDLPLEGRYEWDELNPELGCTNTETGTATRLDT